VESLADSQYLNTPRLSGQDMTMFAFTDNLDIEEGKPIVVRVTIALVAEDQGGRHGPFTKGFRPNHNFGGPDDRFFFIGQIEVEDGVWVYPGETRDLKVTFLNARGLLELLVPGRIWRIQEGPRLIALGTVIEVE
jgi:translation elongation factor EF-Tu-like GTPase